MRAAYARAMDALYLICVVIAGVSLSLMTLVIPYGVWCRYVLNAALAWPEPFSVLMMVLFVFFGAAAVYRTNAHIGVTLFTDMMPPAARAVVALLVDLLMAGICLFMVIWGWQLCQITWHQVIAEFPFLSVGLTYMPIPVGGAVTIAFIIEKRLCGLPGPDSFIHRDAEEAH